MPIITIENNSEISLIYYSNFLEIRKFVRNGITDSAAVIRSCELVNDIIDDGEELKLTRVETSSQINRQIPTNPAWRRFGALMLSCARHVFSRAS